MTRLYKVRETDQESVARFGRDRLDDFEAVVEVEPDVDEPEPEPVDPEALRAEVLAAAKAEAEQKVREAYEEGLKRGMAAGQAAFEESIAEVAEAVQSVAAQLEEIREGFLNALEPQVLDLAKAIAGRVLLHTVEETPALIQQSVRRALTELADHQQVTARLNPNDLEALREHKVTLLDEFPGIGSLHLEPDETITPGGCVVDSDLAQVDARWETLLTHVLDELDATK